MRSRVLALAGTLALVLTLLAPTAASALDAPNCPDAIDKVTVNSVGTTPNGVDAVVRFTIGPDCEDLHVGVITHVDDRLRYFHHDDHPYDTGGPYELLAMGPGCHMLVSVVVGANPLNPLEPEAVIAKGVKPEGPCEDELTPITEEQFEGEPIEWPDEVATDTTTDMTVETTEAPETTQSTESTTTTTTAPEPACPEDGDAATFADTDYDEDTATVTASFTLADGCEDVPVTLATYRTGDDVSLVDKVTGRFDAGDHTLTLKLPETCDITVLVLRGQAPATSPGLTDPNILAGGVRTTARCADDRAAAQPVRAGGSLPFTGAMVLPLLLIGLAMLVGGTSFLLLTRGGRHVGQRHP